MTWISSACGPLLARLRLANCPRSIRYSGRSNRSAEHYDANLNRCVRPQQVAQIDLRSPADVTSAPNTATQTQLGVSDRSAQALGRRPANSRTFPKLARVSKGRGRHNLNPFSPPVGCCRNSPGEDIATVGTRSRGGPGLDHRLAPLRGPPVVRVAGLRPGRLAGTSCRLSSRTMLGPHAAAPTRRGGTDQPEQEGRGSLSLSWA
jgi:hypothetical protein